MGMVEAVIFTLVLVAVIAIGFGINHALLSAAVNKLDAYHATFLKVMADHGVKLESVDGKLTGHTSILETLEDKAKNAISSLEASKFVVELEAVLGKGDAMLKSIVDAANPPPPVSVTVVPAATTAPGTGTTGAGPTA